MKTLKLIALVALAFTFSRCKTQQPTAPAGPAPSLLEVVNILDSARSMFIDAVDASGGDPYKAIEQTAGYLSLLPGVRDVYPEDSSDIHIILNSGLKANFCFNLQDSAGYSIFRGGRGNKDTYSILKDLKPVKPLAANTIQNKKVLLFAPFIKDGPLAFPGGEEELQKIIKLIANSGLGLEVTVLRDEQCRYDIANSFSDYGLVILETHGKAEGFLTGNKIDFDVASDLTEEEVKNLVNTQLQPGVYEKIISGDLELLEADGDNLLDPKWIKRITKKGPIDLEVIVPSKYIEELPQMPNTVIFGNMCFSGWISTSKLIPRWEWKKKDGTIVVHNEKTIIIDPIAKAFLNRNPISYYGYTRDLPQSGTSRQVLGSFCEKMEDSLLKRLVTAKDSTGIANRSHILYIEFFDPAREFREGDLYFRHYGADDYSYNGCVDHFTDDRDGQTYKAVCIGKQTWMAENLRYNAPGSACYDDDPNNCITYGKLYDWNTIMNGSASSSSNPSQVQGICPKGWHVPSVSEWSQLITQLGGDQVAGFPLKATSLWTNTDGSTNSSGFTALPGGYCNLYQGAKQYVGIGEAAYFWTSLEYSQLPTGAYSLGLLTGFAAVNLSGGVSKTNYNSCRCLKD